MLAAALKEDVPVVGLHLTRPPIEIPDREKLGMPSHFESARGAYVVRSYTDGAPRGGTIIVQGTSSMANIVKLLPEFEKNGPNVKIVCATSPQLFANQPQEYKARVLTAADRVDSTVITTQGRWLMHDWIFNKVAEEYALSADWDNQWRTGGTVEDVLEEAHLSPDWILKGIEKFASDREQRLKRLQAEVNAALD